MSLRALLSVVVGLSVASGCHQAEPEPNRLSQAVSVTWTNMVGVSSTGNGLIKTSASSNWLAGASSLESMSGNCHVQFSTAENTTNKMVGLGNVDASPHYADIEFAIQLRANGAVAVYESGTLRGSFGRYAAGDVFRVEVVAGEVFYKRNGTTFYSSLTPASFPLVVDTSLFTPGATISDVELGGDFWQNAVGVALSPTGLTKTSTDTTRAAGASSVALINGDGYTEFTTAENDTAKVAGLSHGDSNLGVTDIDFAFSMAASGDLAVYEGGVNRGVFGTYAPGDVLRIAVSSGVVSYLLNGVLLYTSASAPTFPLGVDTSLRTPGATIQDVSLVALPGPFIGPTAYVKASNTAAGDAFGYSVSISGDTMVIGAPSEGGGVGAGQAYVFVRSGDSWVQQARLVPSDAGYNQLFGVSVAISGDTLVVGAPLESSIAAESGAAYVFTRTGTAWTQQAFVKAAAPDSGDLFGGAVAIDGDTMVIGSIDGDSATIFARSDGVWSQQAFLTGPITFGRSVTVSGDTVAVGARRSFAAGEPGLVRVFTRSGSIWSPQAQIKPTASLTAFGTSVSLSGQTLAIGAPYSDFVSRMDGAVYVYTRSGTSWSKQALLGESNGDPQDLFGVSVSLSGDTLAVAANLEDSGATGVDGDEADDSMSNSGAVYVFTRSGVVWSQSAYLKASNTASDDLLGSEEGVGGVSVSGTTVVAGAPYEDSNATGVNGDQSNDGASNSGAVYVFESPSP